MPDPKGDHLYVNLGATQVRKRLQGFGFGVRMVQSSGRNKAVIIHTAAMPRKTLVGAAAFLRNHSSARELRMNLKKATQRVAEREWMGAEQPPVSSGETAILGQGAAESGAVGAPSGPIDSDLRTVIDAWPDLPKSVRTDIVAAVRSIRSR